MVSVKPAQAWHVAFVAENMRQADREELEALGQDSEEGIWQAFRASEQAWVMQEDAPMCVFGVIPTNLLTGEGIIWLLGTDNVKRHARGFLEVSPGCLQKIMATYSHLHNYVDQRNKASIRWLKWMGFEFQEAQPLGPRGLPFHRFDKRA